MSFEALLFDLDGTLVDTAPDLISVLNQLLVERGRPRMPYAIARNEASNGAAGLIRLGFGSSLAAEQVDSLRRRFLELYALNICVKSRLLIDLESLSDIEDDVDWGIVTNKPAAFTVPLLERLGLDRRASCVISGDRLPQRKPDPAPLLLAAAELGVVAERCVYVGDAPRDIEAGRAAGMTTIAAAYGYIRPADDPTSWGADLVLRRPADLPMLLAELRQRRTT